MVREKEETERFWLFKAKSPPKCRRGYKRRIIPW